MSLLAGLCVRECAGKGVCAPATCEEGWCPMGGCRQAGSSWRGGGAEAGAGAALLSSQSQSPERTELEFHIQLKFPAVAFSSLVFRISPRQRGVDQTGFLDLQPPDSCPAFTEGISLLGIVPLGNFARRSQPAGCS